MAFLQKRFSHSTKSGLLKKKSGFVLSSLLFFLSLLMSFLIGFSLLSVGIKNITKSQSLCIKGLIKTQRELNPILTKLLSLNHRVKELHHSRQALSASIAIAAASIVLVPTVPALEKTREAVKLLQKAIRFQQEALLLKSDFVKRKNLNQLKLSLQKQKALAVRETSFFKKALALEKEELGKEAFIYKPLDNFKQNQKIRLSWTLNPFGGLSQDWKTLLNAKRKQSCAATLEKQGEKWISRLSH